MSWLNSLKSHVEKMNNAFTTNERNCFVRENEHDCLQRKLQSLNERKGKLLKSTVDGRVLRTQQIGDLREVNYLVHFQHFIKQKNKYFMEEKVEERKAVFSGEEIIDDFSLEAENIYSAEETAKFDRDIGDVEERYQYSRIEAVRYAERWWDDYNPQYKKFENNCTNFVSQCLRAGGAPMSGSSNRSQGWWFRNKNWSFSWAVAHSMRWYLSGAKSGLRAKEMAKPEELMKGDVICYDFSGDGRWQHTTIVVAKDENNMPLVNAQTTNSRMRYWAYEDSTAWTPNIKYKFFHIIGE